jgi:hypothetical protein
MKLMDFVVADAIQPGLVVATKEEAVRALVSSLV